MSRGKWSDQQFSALPSLVVAAHELKSPITLMRQLGLLLDSSDLALDERQKYQRQLVATSDRALRLVSDLAQAANLHPALFPLEPVNPLAVCQEISREMSMAARLYGRKIDWPKSRGRLLAVANRQLLGRVLANFIDNAVKYTDDSVPIRVLVRRSGGSVVVGVRDYGPRMRLADYRNLIDKMEQRKTLKGRPDSSGLGIFLASEFARAMQGRIGLTRHRDGVTFFVELPASGQMSLL